MELSDENKQITAKVLLVGDIGTGKTSIMKRIVNDKFSIHYKSTIGVDFSMFCIQRDDLTIKLQFWDLAGQERFGSQTRVFYRESAVACVVFDITRDCTFQGVRKWKLDLDTKANLRNTEELLPVILIANKIDAYEASEFDDGKKYCGKDEEEMDRFCKELGFVGWYGVSAKDNTNVKQAVNAIVDIILENEKRFAVPDENSDDLKGNKNVILGPVETSGGCCF